MRIPLLALSLLFSGCLIHGGDDDPQPCEEVRPDEAYPQDFRNPESGTCQNFGGGGGGGDDCWDWGGGNTEPADPVPPGGAFLDWASCDTQCEGLAEDICLVTSACRAAYAINITGDQEYLECWGTAPSGPIQGGDCESLDAYGCSLHDDCSPLHSLLEVIGGNPELSIALGPFERCMPESGSDPGECLGQIACDALPPNCPSGTVAGIRDGCWTGYCIPQDQCQGLETCETLSENQCVARSDCDGLYQGVDCTCEGNSCTCASWLFEGCESAP